MAVSPTGYVDTQLSLSPGVAIPPGDSLCVGGGAVSGFFETLVTATGYLAPPGSVSNGPLQAVPALKR
jgi:hypothetical protein